MSQDLESIVRPFQTKEVTPAQTYYAPGQAGVPNVILRIGRGGSGKVLTGSYSYSASFYCDGSETEKATAEFKKQLGFTPGGPGMAGGSAGTPGDGHGQPGS
jgi:hypothetical protein